MAQLRYGAAVDSYDSIPHILAGAQAKELYDRDEELFIFSSEANREKFIQFLDDNQFSYERLDLVQVEDVVYSPLFTDYGFITKNNSCYFYAHLVAIFTFKDGSNDHDKTAALLQMEEHIIVTLENDEKNWHVVDQELRTLIDGISAAYVTEIEWKKI